MKIPNNLPYNRQIICYGDEMMTNEEISYLLLACNNFPKAIELLKDVHSILKIEGYGCKGIEEFLDSLENESNL